MKKLMKTTISTLAVLLFVAGTTVTAQQSDYQVVQDFRADYNELVERVDNAVSSEELSEINADIDALEADNSGHSSLIDGYIYPNSFEGKISDLRSRYAAAENNVQVIESLNEKVAELEDEMAELRDRLSALDEDSQALANRLERAAQNERRLSNLVRQYRENLENRDAFVSDLLEDLLKRYQTMDAQTQEEIAAAAEALEDNPLDLLRTILAEYINLAEREAGLDSEDYLRMRAQHGYFSEVWDNVGERMASTYAAEEPVQAKQEIDDHLDAWLASVDNKLWNALSTSFNQSGVQLPSFTSATAFNNALNTYVDEMTEVSLGQNSEEDYEMFSNFSEFWNSTVKAEWGEFLVAGNVLSQGDIAAIDVKVGSWGQAAEPVSNLMFILFLVSLAVIIGLIVLLVTKKE